VDDQKDCGHTGPSDHLSGKCRPKQKKPDEESHSGVHAREATDEPNARVSCRGSTSRELPSLNSGPKREIQGERPSAWSEVGLGREHRCLHQVQEEQAGGEQSVTGLGVAEGDEEQQPQGKR